LGTAEVVAFPGGLGDLELRAALQPPLLQLVNTKTISPAEKGASNPLFVSRPGQLFPTNCAGRETNKQLPA
jgi:hypothetical protein